MKIVMFQILFGQSQDGQHKGYVDQLGSLVEQPNDPIDEGARLPASAGSSLSPSATSQPLAPIFNTALLRFLVGTGHSNQVLRVSSTSPNRGGRFAR
ncbi:MAG TPA: hypothetical protein VF509_04015 [Sphingobium sp.]